MRRHWQYRDSHDLKSALPAMKTSLQARPASELSAMPCVATAAASLRVRQQRTATPSLGTPL